MVFLRRKLKFPNILAVVIFVFLILGAVIADIAMTLPIIRDQSENLTLLRVENLQYELQEIYREVSEAFGTCAEKVEQVVKEADIEHAIVIASFSQPYIFSNSVKSHPLEIFIVITLASLLFRVIGMIAAVLAYTVTKVVLKEFFPKAASSSTLQAIFKISSIRVKPFQLRLRERSSKH